MADAFGTGALMNGTRAGFRPPGFDPLPVGRIKRFLARFRPRPKPKWRQEMMVAIRECASEGALFKGTSLSFGLRCIRTFERVNGLAFDPFNRPHRDTVRHMGTHEYLHWKMRRFFDANH